MDFLFHRLLLKWALLLCCQGTADAASDDEHHWEDEENEDLHKEYVDELAEDSLG